MAQQNLNVGTTANDGTGDTLRASQIKVQSNFDELYARPDFTDAPSDGNIYGRKDGTWEEVTGGGGTTPTLNEVTNEGNETTNPIIYDDGTGLKVETGVGGGGFAWYFKLLNIGTNFRQYLTNDSNTDDRTATFPDKDITIAGLDDIPTTATDLDALKRDGSNANSDVDLGNNSVLSKTFFVGESNKMNILADILTDNRYARFQDKDYDGIADITDIPDVSNLVVKNTAITGATKTKITYDSKGLVTAGADLIASDIPTIAQSQVTNLVSDLAGKQATLGYTPYRFIQTSQTAHTGTLTETIVATATINGGAFNTSDVMKALYGLNKGTTTSGVILRLKINTSNTLTGAVQIAQFNTTGTGTVSIMKRNFMLNGGNLYGLNFANTTVISDEVNNATTYSSTAYNTANTLYLFFTIQLITSADSVTPNLFNITN